LRLVELENRMDFTAFLPFNSVCAELGVFKGHFSAEILKRLNPKRLYLIDPYWKKYGDIFWNGKGTMDCWKCAVKRVRQNDINKVASMVVDNDIDFLKDLPDGFFDWLYIDSTHEYEDTLKELEIVSEKVKDTGLIAGHDWYDRPTHKHYGVHKAIEEWLLSNPQYELYLRDNKTQWIIKKSNAPVKRNISFCTTCMNRLNDIRETLPFNIFANEHYPNLEFVLLDYNSSDGLGEWIRENMMEHIVSGRLKYYRIEGPEYFDMSYSRNVAFKLATGEIVNNLDADNYTVNPNDPPIMSFAERLNKTADIFSEKVIFGKSRQFLHGRIGFYRHEFISLGGYDEDIKGYGYDDTDLLIRAECMGFKLDKWGGQFCERIKTWKKDKDKNLEYHWDDTRRENRLLSQMNVAEGKFVANKGKKWGRATVMKNFREKVEVW